ncbi:MAG: hypothetical protein QM784_19220 [Polyangiaceae bacterium]
MPDITVIRNAHTVVAFNAATGGHAYLNDADVAFDDSGFLHVGGRYDGPFTREISGRDRMVLPGFVNVHCHSGEAAHFEKPVRGPGHARHALGAGDVPNIRR